MRYFLNIRSGVTVIPDLEGAEFIDLAAARLEAIRSARELLADMIRRGEILNGRAIEICDENGRVLDIIGLREQIRISQRE